MVTEQSFTTELLKWAKTYGWRCFHVRNSGFGGNSYVQGDKGFPDLVLVKPPRLIFAELKIGKKKPTAEQQAWLGALSWQGEPDKGAPPFPLEWADVQMTIETHVWRPDNWSEILAVLAR